MKMRNTLAWFSSSPLTSPQTRELARKHLWQKCADHLSRSAMVRR